MKTSEELELLVSQTLTLIEDSDNDCLKDFLDNLNISDIEVITNKLPDYAVLIVDTLSVNRAVNVFRILDAPTQEKIIRKLPSVKISELINLLPPDDKTAFFGELKDRELQHKLISYLSIADRKELMMLLSYPEDSVARLMTPDFLAISQDYTVAQTLEYIRKYGKNSETIDVIYILDEGGRLIDDLRIRELLISSPETSMNTLMDGRYIYLDVTTSVEDAIKIFKMNNRVALPVIDDNNVLLGIVTIDDMLWVAEEESSEDMQRMGGTSALDQPYMDLPIYKLVWKRAGWLVILFIGELFTASVMTHFENELAKAIVLALFLPLMISSGGNSGSQASTLIIQAMAKSEIHLKDWWRVFRRELLSGFSLGIILGCVGFLRITVWHYIFPHDYGHDWLLVGTTVWCALIGIVLWGSLIGSMLPFILKKLGADPAASSAPFVATLVDVTGLMIYLTIASIIFGL